MHAYTSLNGVHIWRCVPDGPLGRRGRERHRALDCLELRIYGSKNHELLMYVYTSVDTCKDEFRHMIRQISTYECMATHIKWQSWEPKL